MIIHSPQGLSLRKAPEKNNSKTIADSIVNSHVPIMPWHSETITPKMQSAVPRNQAHMIYLKLSLLGDSPWNGPQVIPVGHGSKALQITYCNQSSPIVLKIHEPKSRRNWILKYGFPQHRYDSESREELTFPCKILPKTNSDCYYFCTL